MLPANNKGVGMSAGFPDVCVTPPGIPTPYPNFSFNAMKMPFSPNVWFSCLPALNMASISPTTLGDQGGTMSPFMGPSWYTFGNFRTLVNFLPSTSLLCPRTGNSVICPLGTQVIPSLTNVFLTYKGENVDRGGEGEASGQPLNVEDVEDVAQLVASLKPCGGASPVEHARLERTVGYIKIRRFSLDVPARVHAAMAAFGCGRSDGDSERLTLLVIDLRGNPGGELTAFVELAGDFLPRGSILCTLVDADGDEIEYRSTHESPYRVPLQILVNSGTASAAELFAGCLQSHGRAVIAGEPTYGKGTALTLLPEARTGAPVLAAVGDVILPDGRSIQGVGVLPDVADLGLLHG